MVLLLVNLLLLASIALLVFITRLPFNALLDETAQDDVYDDDVCESRICHEAATKILNDMDNTIDPCDDFYSFACGNFIKNTRVPDNENVVIVFDSFSDEIAQKLKITLEGPSPANEPKYIRSVKNFYKSCMKAGVESRNNKSEENSSLSAKCVLVLLRHIPTQILYVREYFKPDALLEATRLFNDVKNIFIDVISRAEWLDNDAKIRILEKHTTVKSYIGGPDMYWNDTMMDEVLENFVFDENDYQANMQRIYVYLSKIRPALSELLPAGSIWRRKLYAATSDANHYPVANSIAIPAGFFQGAFFNNARPWYMNYATIVPIIAHEMAHTYHRLSYISDYLIERESRAVELKLNSKIQCFVEQYSDFTIEGIGEKIDGFITRRENIADNVGFKIAYMAHDTWSKSHGKEQRLPGLDYSPNQMFWISAANLLCTKYRPEKMKDTLSGDAHSPPQFRILGSFQNRPEFAADFGCELGSRMNPVKKCDLW